MKERRSTPYELDALAEMAHDDGDHARGEMLGEDAHALRKVLQHTPGPWFAMFGPEDSWKIESKDQNIAKTLSDNHEANAHLIAAAPDLLEAAKAFIAPSHTASTWEAAKEALEAAIAKVETS